MSADSRECGWMGCGDPRCEPVCAGVARDDGHDERPYFYDGGNPYVCQFEQHSDCQVDGHSDHCRFIAREAEMICEAEAKAWSAGHAAGRDYAGDGWNSDSHDPERDNPYLRFSP